MINVAQIEINLILPVDEVRIVAMQPYLELLPEEPFKIIGNRINDQLRAIRKTLDLAKSGLDQRSSHFTIFPEYSVPGQVGIEIIDQLISSPDFSNDSVVLAGIHGLTKNEFQNIYESFDITLSAVINPDDIPNNEWINCCFIWIKENNGEIKRFIQLKIYPSWPENNVTCNDMFKGSTIFVFNYHYSNNVASNFTCFICFDWVVSLNGNTVSDELLTHINNTSNNITIHLDMVFVIQHNPSPNHTTFLRNTSQFLNSPNLFPFVDRKDAVVLHLNTAVAEKPSKNGNGAFSSCVFSSRAPLDISGCRQTVCMQPEILRNNQILKDDQCKDVLFREMGSCIHRYKIKVSRFLGAGPANRNHPISEAEVHALNDVVDPRLSGKAIPASLKWFNDSLDEIISLAEKSLVECNLFNNAKNLHSEIISKFRLIDNGIVLKNKINWARAYKKNEITNANPSYCDNPDIWDYPELKEKNALEHILHTITSLGLAFNLEIEKNSDFHGTLVLDEKYIQVVAIQSESYSGCRLHYENNISKETIDPVLVVLSNKTDYRPTQQELKKYYETDSENGIKFLAYNILVTLSRDAESIQNFTNNINEYLPSDRRII